MILCDTGPSVALIDGDDQYHEALRCRFEHASKRSLIKCKPMRDLMLQYHDTPMDLADASLVSAAERQGLTRGFTLDSHFRIYRNGGVKVFDVIP